MSFYDGTYITLKYRQLVYLYERDRDVLRRRIEMQTDENLETVRDILWDLCMSIDKNGNKGYGLRGVIDWGVAAGYTEDQITKVLKTEEATTGILFRGTGSGKRDFSGYGVRKNPPWQQSWAELYGWDNDKAQGWIAELWDEAIEHDHELNQKKARPRDEVFGIELATIPTIDLGRRWVLLKLMAEQQFSLQDETPQFLGNLYSKYASTLMAEIMYRGSTLPDGEEKTMCHEIVGKYVYYFFTFDTWQWLRGSREVIDIDWNQQLPISFEAKNAQVMTDKNLIRKFLMLLEPDGGKGEGITNETIQLILGTLRKLLKNARSDW